ncbi:MAG: hypothetical protein WCD64_08800 [Pseudolabrys sp.]
MIDLKCSRSNISIATGSLRLACAAHSMCAFSKKEQSRQMISARGGTVNVHVVVLDHQHDDEGGAYRIDDRFERKHREPRGIVIRRQESTHGQRHEKDSGMNTRHHDRGSARVSCPVPFAPKLEGDEKRIDRDDQRAEDLTVAVFQRARNLTDAQPQGRTDKGRRRQHTPALKEPYTVPDHSAGKKGQRTRDNSISGVGMLASAIAEAPIR